MQPSVLPSRQYWSASFFACVLYLATSAALDNGQSLRPPMGWLSWERFRCNTDCTNDPENCISEHLIRQMADRLADDGFLAAGYNVVGIDDCWLADGRDPQGKLQPDPLRFPSGIKALADYVHARLPGLNYRDTRVPYELKGLSAGDIGTKTCGGYPGMAGNLEVDAQTYADWGVDYLKVDGCYADAQDFSHLYPLLGDYLNKTGRPIVYSCSWPAYLPDPVATGFKVPYQQLAQHCNLWRNWVDIQDSWDSLASILAFWAEESRHSPAFQMAAGPGGWNDPDMLIIGNQGLTEAQCEVQMGMWAVFAAPLLMSNDLRQLSQAARNVLLNKAAISVNQDPLGIQGVILHCPGGCKVAQLWYRALAGDARALAFLNLSDQPLGRLCIHWAEVGWMPQQTAQVISVFDGGSDVPGEVAGKLCTKGLPPASVKLFVLRKEAVVLDMQ